MGLVNGGLINVAGKRGTTSAQLALSDGLACFTGSFSGVTTTQISHGLGSTDLVVEFKDHLGNLLIPDTWSIVNNNTIEVEFTPAATGDVTVIACIESGLSPVTGGVLILEGLSGIIDLDCPNGSVDISTSGQVINICALFTPASGAILEQKCRDIETLSGLIGGGVLASGASAKLTFTPASGTEFVLEHGLGTTTWTWDMWSTETDPITIMMPENIYPSGNNHVAIVLDTPVSGCVVLTTGGGQGVVGPPGSGGGGGGSGIDTQTSINGLSGTVFLTSPNDAITISESGQTIQLSGLFDSTSGILLNTVSDLVASGVVNQLNGLSGIVNLVSGLTNTVLITFDDNDIVLDIDPTQTESILTLSGISKLVTAESLDFQSTTSTTFVEALSLDWEVTTSGTYRAQWSFQGSCSQANKVTNFRIQLDDFSGLMNVETSFNVAAGNLQFGGFSQFPLGTGLHSVDFDFRFADTGGGAAEVENLRLEVLRID